MYLKQPFMDGQQSQLQLSHLNGKKKHPREILWHWTEQQCQQDLFQLQTSMSLEQHMMWGVKHRVKIKAELEHVEYLQVWSSESQQGMYISR